MTLKVMLISILIFIVLRIICMGVVNSLSPIEKITNNFPTHVIIIGLLVALSFVETVVSIICWIVSL